MWSPMTKMAVKVRTYTFISHKNKTYVTNFWERQNWFQKAQQDNI